MQIVQEGRTLDIIAMETAEELEFFSAAKSTCKELKNATDHLKMVMFIRVVQILEVLRFGTFT